MKKPTFFNSAISLIVHAICICLIAFVVLSCKSDKNVNTATNVETIDDNAVTITTNAMDFVMVSSLPSGWHTFRYINKSTEPHFFLVEKYPEGKSLADGKKEVIPVFQNGMNMIMQGKPEEAGSEFARLPEWFGQVQFHGGSGIVSPKGTSITTLYLEPGYYVVECYMKMTGGIFHSSVGMVRALDVTDSGETKGDAPVTHDIDLTISSTEGIIQSEPVKSGKHTFRVEFLDQIVHENFVGHDINLAEIDKNVDLDALEAWMNWADPNGLLSQPPEGVTFLGGVNDMYAGGVGYFTATFKKRSQYVFISEVPNSRNKNMLQTFTVSR